MYGADDSETVASQTTSGVSCIATIGSRNIGAASTQGAILQKRTSPSATVSAFPATGLPPPMGEGLQPSLDHQ